MEDQTSSTVEIKLCFEGIVKTLFSMCNTVVVPSKCKIMTEVSGKPNDDSDL